MQRLDYLKPIRMHGIESEADASELRLRRKNEKRIILGSLRGDQKNGPPYAESRLQI